MSDDLIQSFAQEVSRGKMSFTIHSDRNGINIRFITSSLGTAIAYYGFRTYDKDLCWNPEQAYVLAAVKQHKGPCYIVNPFVFGIDSYYHKPDLHDNCRWLADLQQDIKKTLQAERLPRFISRLKLDDLTDAMTVRQARRRVFGIDKGVNTFDVDVKDTDVLKVACGMMSVDGLINALLANNVQKIKLWASREKTVEENMKECAETWEIDMAKALIESGAKTVDVEFYVNAHTANARLDVEKIVDTLSTRGAFDYYDFKSQAVGLKVMYEELELDRNGKFPQLTCDNIVSIKYRGKVIYDLPF